MNIEETEITIFITYEIGIGGAGYACAEYLKEFDSLDIKTALIYQNGSVPSNYKGFIHRVTSVGRQKVTQKIKKIAFSNFPHNPSNELISFGTIWNHQRKIKKIIKSYCKTYSSVTIYVHWVNFGFLSLRTIQRINKIKNAQVIWQLHDLWPLQDLFHTPGTYLTQEALLKSWSAEGHPNMLQTLLTRRSRRQKKRIHPDIKFSTSSQEFKNWLIKTSPYKLIINNENTIVMNFPASRTINYCKSVSQQKHSEYSDKPYIIIPSTHGFDDIRSNVRLTIDTYLKSGIQSVFDLRVIVSSEINLKKIKDPNNITFQNRLERESFIIALSSASAVVVPSLFETYGLTILEALSANQIVGLQSTNPMNLNFKQYGFNYFSGDWTIPSTWDDFYLYYLKLSSEITYNKNQETLQPQLKLPGLNPEAFH